MVQKIAVGHGRSLLELVIGESRGMERGTVHSGAVAFPKYELQRCETALFADRVVPSIANRMFEINKEGGTFALRRLIDQPRSRENIAAGTFEQQIEKRFEHGLAGGTSSACGLTKTRPRFKG